jgi:hypothetical protein
MLSSNLNTPYPPPDLLHPMAEKIQIISPNQGAAEKTEAASTDAQAAQPTPAASAAATQATAEKK